ncbi:GIY-YIG nuclease family protein [Hirschia baltica]|uniref:Putative cytoplasmic protein n=1 Tax=Hirschia baltica (strain ATCC 49814 / DSM 5838 / IFAM 1418) TaxID=582402 RepID=C6XNS5_HIRBI|nr:GIY-YIG nuclease family protein [Hirschia baltica]ACT58328.1 putative cytoplasmic protein [Hirschia baltica ATCC 49814]
MVKEFSPEDDALLAELGVEVETKKATSRSPREERIIAGFEEIQRFVDETGRLPQHGEDKDIFERLYASRLDQIRAQPECHELVEGLDRQGLLRQIETSTSLIGEMDDEALLRELGVEQETGSITELKHVRSVAQIKAAEEIANRDLCENFEEFEPKFAALKTDLENGVRKTIRFRKDAGFSKTDIKQNQFIIVDGQIAYIAEIGDVIQAPNGESDARLRVIYSNGTESDILLRSLIRAMYKDEASRLVSSPGAGPLFSEEAEDDDLASGTVYVLRSKSDHPWVNSNRDVLHKIGVTGGTVERRIANASKQATYLMADVEVVATYNLFNINRSKFENLLHKVFGSACLDVDVKDRFGFPIEPREWFLVPLFVIDEVIEKFTDGTIGNYVYDSKKACLRKL